MVEINIIIKNIRGKIFDECNRDSKPPYLLSGLELVQTFTHEEDFSLSEFPDYLEEKHPCPNPHPPCFTVAHAPRVQMRKLIGLLLPGVGAPNSRQKVNLFRGVLIKITIHNWQ